jgi:hypothetical protein
MNLCNASQYFFTLGEGCFERTTLEGLHCGIELENGVVDVDHRLSHILRCG